MRVLGSMYCASLAKAAHRKERDKNNFCCLVIGLRLSSQREVVLGNLYDTGRGICFVLQLDTRASVLEFLFYSP